MEKVTGYSAVSIAMSGYLRGNGWEDRLLDLLVCLYCAADEAKKEARKEAIAPMVDNITESTFSVEPMAWANPADPETILKAIEKENEKYRKGLEGENGKDEGASPLQTCG